MTGAFLSGCVAFPLVLLGLSAGGGLLVRRLGADWLPAGLVLPVGFALVVATCSFVTYIDWLAPAAGAFCLLFALAGAVLAWRAGARKRPRLTGIPWAALSGLGAFAAIDAPTLLTGTPTWSGYTRLVDIGFQMDFAQYVAEKGRATVGSDSSYHAVVQKLVHIGYPGGGQATLGAIAALIHTDVAWCYQGYHAFAAAMGALAIYSLLGRVSTSGPLRALGAFVAIQPNLLYAYALEGGIKELSTASLLMVVAAVLAERLPGEGRRWSVLPAAVAIAGAFAAFSIGVAPWLGILLVGVFAVTLVRPHRRETLLGWGLLAASAIVISLPGILSLATQLNGIASTAIGGTVELGLGNLSAAVPKWSAAGVWLTGDYRFPLVHVAMTHRLDVFVIVFAVLGLVCALLRRRWVVAFCGIAAPIALAYYIAHSTAWLQFKAFAITGVFALTLAFVGAAALRERGRRRFSWLAWPIAAVLAGGVLYGNAITYHDTTLAPAARYVDLAAIGKRYAGQGPALFPAFDEYAEYFLRREQATSSVNPANGDFELRPGVSEPGGIGFALDLNQFRLSYLQRFKLIVQPRSPTASRAPANWDLVEQTKYFDVWRRERPAADVYVHLPLSDLPHERTRLFCSNMLNELRQAGPGASVAYVPGPDQLELLAAAGVHPHYWRDENNSLIPYGAGSDRIAFSTTHSATYRVWAQGTVGRPIRFTLDGRTVGTLAYDERYPGQFLRVGSVTVAAGRHTLVLSRGGGSLHPGSGDDVDPDTRLLGAIVLAERESSSIPVHVASAAGAAAACAAPVGYQWMEILKPGAAPADALSPRV
jgi:hypothetical protein